MIKASVYHAIRKATEAQTQLYRTQEEKMPYCNTQITIIDEIKIGNTNGEKKKH